MDHVIPIFILFGPPVLFGLVLWAMVRWQRHLIFHPRRTILPLPPVVEETRQEVGILTADGLLLSAWFFPPPDPEAPVILYFHGNTGNLTTGGETFRHLLTLDAGILGVDYRGYGESEGIPSEEGLAMDARAAWDWLVGEAGIHPRRIVLYGRSLGSAVAVRLAAETATGARGLIMESGFADIYTLGAELYPFMPESCARYRFPSREWVAKREVPLLIAHSEQESYIKIHHAHALQAAARPPCHLVVLKGGHEHGWRESWDFYGSVLRAFIHHPESYRRTN